MKVTEKDLQGEIKDFPLRLVQWMCEQQVLQGNKFKPEIFQVLCGANATTGGFTWAKSSFGHINCKKIISLKQFDLFHSLIEANPYPKIMLVNNVYAIDTAVVRQVIMKKGQFYIVWNCEIKLVDSCTDTIAFMYAWELNERFEHKISHNLAMSLIKLFSNNIEFQYKLANLWGTQIALMDEVSISDSLKSQIIAFSTEESKEAIKHIFKT